MKEQGSTSGLRNDGIPSQPSGWCADRRVSGALPRAFGLSVRTVAASASARQGMLVPGRMCGVIQRQPASIHEITDRRNRLGLGRSCAAMLSQMATGCTVLEGLWR
jgi:hypothetical protein